MKIAHICLTGGYTEGINYQENYLTKYHSLAGNDVTVITTQYCLDKNVWSECSDTGYVNKYGVKVIRLPYLFKIPYRLNKHIGKFKGLSEELKNIEPDLIFVHNCQFLDFLKIASYKKNHMDICIVADNHSDFSNSARNWPAKNILYGVYWKRLVKRVEKYVDRFYGVIPAREDFLKNVYGVPSEKVQLLVMGADDEGVKNSLTEKSKKEIRDRYQIPQNAFLIITGGKIDRFKMQTLLLMQAIKEISNPDLYLIVFGSIEEELKKQALSLCDSTHIQYIGWAQGDDSYKYFAASDLAVFPGRHSVYWEEVAGMGIPMVCKYWNGTTHVDKGGNVIFLQNDSVEEIKEVIESIITDSEKYANMKNTAENCRKEFLYSSISARSIELCGRTTGEKE